MKIDYKNLIKQNNLPSPGSKIVVAMSGGVDSSVTAAIFKNAGYEVIGVTMQLYEGKNKKNSKTCCSGLDISDARSVSKKLGIKHYIINYKSRFKESVIDEFVESYLNGETPIPCIRCNQTVKFTDLINFTKSINSSILATGHYVRRIEKKNTINLFQAKDKIKDQSYFLFATTQDQLKLLRFPLGQFTKTEIRELASYFNLNVAQKPDSQDICFIPDGNYKDFIKKNSNQSNGQIVNSKNEVLGTHEGIYGYTIGQRKGIGIGGIKGQNNHNPFYVIKIDKQKNQIVVGTKKELEKHKIYLKDIHLVCRNNTKKFNAKIKFRSSQDKISATVNILKPDNVAIVELNEPESGISPGQACVFYNRNELIGGGWIVAGEKNMC